MSPTSSTMASIESQEYRSLRACKACRIAKVKCSGDPEKACARCAGAAIPCIFPPSRRGRLKGSKNRRTLEKEATSRRTGSEDENRFDWDLNATSASASRPFPDSRVSLSQPMSQRHSVPSVPYVPPAALIVDAPSPIDPLLSSRASPDRPIGGSSSDKDSTSLDRKGIRRLDRTFPTGNGVDVSDKPITPPGGPDVPVAESDIRPNHRDLQYPLLFLADCARRGWDAGAVNGIDRSKRNIPGPEEQLATEDAALFAAWSTDNVHHLLKDQSVYFKHGLYGSKRDVSAGLDAVQRGLVSEREVRELFEAFFRYVHPHCPMLDPQLHTASFVRERSAYLMTVVLALGAVGIATSTRGTKRDLERASKLYAHAEKVHLVIYATSAKSTEIIQAQLLFVMWASRTPRLVDDCRAIRLGAALRMAGMIGLHLSKGQVAPRKGGQSERIARNDLRLRLCLILQESRWESLAERNLISGKMFDLSDAEADELDDIDPLHPEAILAADYALHRFEEESKERISRIAINRRSEVSFDSERTYIMTFLDAYNAKWCQPQKDLLSRWRFRVLSLQSWLVGLLRLAKARSQAGLPSDKIRSDLLATALALIEGVLEVPRALHMLRPTSNLVFAAAIVMQLSEPESGHKDLVLRLGLRMAGDPGRSDFKLYLQHNGYQILNMLVLTKEARDGSSGASRKRHSPIAFANGTLPHAGQVPPAPMSTGASTHASLPEVQPPVTVPNIDAPWSDLDQLLAYNGNVDFPYISNLGSSATFVPQYTNMDEPPQSGGYGRVASGALVSHETPATNLVPFQGSNAVWSNSSNPDVGRSAANDMTLAGAQEPMANVFNGMGVTDSDFGWAFDLEGADGGVPGGLFQTFHTAFGSS